MTLAAPGLRMLAVLALFATAMFGVATPAMAQGGGGQYGGMVIGATSCDGQGSCWNEIGATFTGDDRKRGVPGHLHGHGRSQ
jgi:hypothetical protein